MRIMICLAYHFSAVLCLFFSRVVRIVLIPTWVLAKKRPIHLPKKSTPGFRSSASLRKGKGTSMSNRGVQKKLCHSSGNCQLQTQPFDQVILLTPCESRNHSLHRRFFKEAFLHHRITLLWMTHNEHIATSHYCHHKSHHYLTSHYAPHYHKSIQTITLHHSTRSKSSSAATSVQAGTPARFERTGPLFVRPFSLKPHFFAEVLDYTIVLGPAPSCTALAPVFLKRMKSWHRRKQLRTTARHVLSARQPIRKVHFRTALLRAQAHRFCNLYALVQTDLGSGHLQLHLT